jgi:hypothetical protein
VSALGLCVHTPSRVPHCGVHQLTTSTAQLARRLTRTAGWARAQLVVMLADGSNGSVEDNTQLKAVTDSFQIR